MREPPPPTPSLTVRRLVAYLLDADPGAAGAGGTLDPALADCSWWLMASPRFRAFSEENRDKIRKKLRGATSAEARLDVRAELRLAASVLADRRIELAFEAYGAGRRGPDFAATFRAGRPFNIEVTRRHGAGGDRAVEGAILGKLRQLPPSAANVLVIALAGTEPAPDPAPMLRDLRVRADRRDDAFFAAGGVYDAQGFHAGLLRLAAVVTWAEAAGEGARVAGWANPGARVALPDVALRALLAALGA
jgi:hypothetical protein